MDSTARKLAIVAISLIAVFGAGQAAEREQSYLIAADPQRWGQPGRSSVKEASEGIRVLGGVHYETGSCGDLMVGPFINDELITAEKFWIELIKPHCKVIYKPIDIEPGGIAGLPTAGQTEHNFSIDEMPRTRAFDAIAGAGAINIRYVSNDRPEGLMLVGPIRGRMSANKAFQLAMRGANLRVIWVDDKTASIELASRMAAYADMSVCPCNFGLPELRPVRSEHVTVTDSRLPSIEDYVQGQVATFDRKDIAATGVSSVPDLLRYATQFPYMRSRGYRLSGAQYAEVRGLEPQYTLVLINGTRADVSASDLMASAFDLNNVPISAVEAIEISAGSPSLVHGMDAIGGIVNIVLRDTVSNLFAEVRYGSASGGARERIGTVAAGTSTNRAKTALFLDYFETTELLGAERDRWRNMDYTRFGHADRRTQFSSPPNIYTLDGNNLPGLDAPAAAVSILPSGEIAFRPGETNMTSSLAMHALVPAMKRASLTGVAEMDLGTSKLSGEALLVHRQAHFQMEADIVPGYTMAAGHPENPFDTPVAVDAALVGLPPRATDSRSELLRGLVRLEGPIGSWRYLSFLRYSKEQAASSRVNFVDAAAVMNGLAAIGDSAISILTARPGEFAGRSILAPRHGNSAESGGTHFSARIDGVLPVFGISATLGVEYRTEGARFDARLGRLDRHEASAFSLLELPLGEHIDVTYGMRVDDFSDLERIRREQWGLSWRPTSEIELRAAYNEAYHAPSLYDLYLPRVSTPVPVFDARRQEVSSVGLIAGGNPDLEPTSGASSSLGVTFENDNGFTASVDLWRIRMRDHISPVSPFALLANESEAIENRILRGAPTALDDQAGRPGRLLALDVSRANVGEIEARGVDISIRESFETSVGTFAPRVDLTYTEEFRYSDLPIRDAPMRDRAGIASVLGTIPSWRGTCSLGYSGYGWGFNVFARYHSSYSDYSLAMSTISDRDIPSRALWDLTISKEMGARIQLEIGVSDLLNRAPPYAEVGDPLGFDVSQADLTGRTAFIRVHGTM